MSNETNAALLSSLEVARQKIAAQIEIYAPSDLRVREHSIDAMRAAIKEFEAAVREDERALSMGVDSRVLVGTTSIQPLGSLNVNLQSPELAIGAARAAEVNAGADEAAALVAPTIVPVENSKIVTEPKGETSVDAATATPPEKAKTSKKK